MFFVLKTCLTLGIVVIVIEPCGLNIIFHMSFRKMVHNHWQNFLSVLFHILCINLIFQENCHIGGLNVLGYIQQLLKTRYTQCHILVWYTSQVESVQCHLSCWLTNRLSSNRTNWFSCWNQRLMELILNFFQKSAEGVLRYLDHFTKLFTCKVVHDVNSEHLNTCFLLEVSD